MVSDRESKAVNTLKTVKQITKYKKEADKSEYVKTKTDISQVDSLVGDVGAKR